MIELSIDIEKILNLLMKASNQIEVWKLFLDLRHSGSIRKTAEQYGRDSAEISRTLSKLEKELKVPLLDRRSRPFRLTETGEELFPLVEDMVGRYEELLGKIEQKADKESAIIKIMVPNTFVSISHSLFFEYIKFFPKHKIRVITPVNTEEFQKGALISWLSQAMSHFRTLFSSLAAE